MEDRFDCLTIPEALRIAATWQPKSEKAAVVAACSVQSLCKVQVRTVASFGRPRRRCCLTDDDATDAALKRFHVAVTFVPTRVRLNNSTTWSLCMRTQPFETF